MISSRARCRANSLLSKARAAPDAFSYLLRSRIVYGSAAHEPGGAQLYRVRDRLFVHFYRRRYGQASGLTAIAELLERVLTPDERDTCSPSRNTGQVRPGRLAHRRPPYRHRLAGDRHCFRPRRRLRPSQQGISGPAIAAPTTCQRCR